MALAKIEKKWTFRHVRLHVIERKVQAPDFWPKELPCSYFLRQQNTWDCHVFDKSDANISDRYLPFQGRCTALDYQK